MSTGGPITYSNWSWRSGSIRPSSSRTRFLSIADPRCTRRSATSRTVASRSCSSPGVSRMHSQVPQSAMHGWSRSLHDQIATGLGYFSLALGLTELLAPRAVSRAAGLDGHETVVQAYGAREIATGIAILTGHDATPWIWGRVAGDAADIATVVAGNQEGSPHRENTPWALLALAGVTALDVMCAIGLPSEKGRPSTARANYLDRSGFPRGVEATRGAARDFEPPRDMQSVGLDTGSRFRVVQTARSFAHAIAGNRDGVGEAAGVRGAATERSVASASSC